MLTITQHINGDGLGCGICVNYLNSRGSEAKAKSWQWLIKGASMHQGNVLFMARGASMH